MIISREREKYISLIDVNINGNGNRNRGKIARRENIVTNRNTYPIRISGGSFLVRQSNAVPLRTC